MKRKREIRKKRKKEVVTFDKDPFLNICKLGKYDELHAVIDDYNINICDGDGVNGLMLACTIGHVDMTRLLVARGVLLNVRNNQGNFELDCAIASGKLEIVKLLLKNGSCRRPGMGLPNEENPIGGYLRSEPMTIFEAVVYNKPEDALRHLEMGTSSEMRDNSGRSLMRLLIMTSSLRTKDRDVTKLVNLLLKYGARKITQ